MEAEDTVGVRTAQRWHMVSDRPMASGPDPPNPDLSESHVANTVNTRTNVMTSSMPNISPLLMTIAGFGAGVPSMLLVLSAVSALRIPAPTRAPTVCTTTYRTALQLNRYTPT